MSATPLIPLDLIKSNILTVSQWIIPTMSSTTTIELSPLPFNQETVLVADNLRTSDNQTGAFDPTVNPHIQDDFSKGRSAAVIITVAGVNFLNTLGSGILTVALPQIAKDLHLSREILLW